jgi:hypothetical protein
VHGQFASVEEKYRLYLLTRIFFEMFAKVAIKGQ